ncbi:MAG: hypothetical protein ABI416_01915 [Ginsengibacter sp.]
MKNLLLLFFCIFALNTLHAQVPTAMSPEASNFYSIAMPAIRQQVKNIVLQTAGAIKHYTANADSLSQKLHVSRALKGLSNTDIEGIIVLIMVQASRDADAELKLMVLGMGRRNEQKQQEPTTASLVSAGNKIRSAEEISDMENLKLRTIMERKSSMAEQINNVMKNILGSRQNIINNLR